MCMWITHPLFGKPRDRGQGHLESNSAQAVYSETEQRVEVMQRQRDDERRQCRGGDRGGWLKWWENHPKYWAQDFRKLMHIFHMNFLGFC